MIPPAAITGVSSAFTSSRVRATVPRRSSGAAGSNTPRWPPASYPCATTASTPAVTTFPLFQVRSGGEQNDSGGAEGVDHFMGRQVEVEADDRGLLLQ